MKNIWNKKGDGREGSGKYFHLLVVLHCGTFYLELCGKLMFNYWKHNSSHSAAKQYLHCILSRHSLIDKNIEKLQHGWNACVSLRACVRWLVPQGNHAQKWQNARTLHKRSKKETNAETPLHCLLVRYVSINWCFYLNTAELIIDFTLFVRMVSGLSGTLSVLSTHTRFFGYYCWLIRRL